ncbi:MAG: hypothetical protein SNJ84_04165, partial [Verrucomicrobiia bacterium]
FEPQHRGHALESFQFGPDGIVGHLAKDRVSFRMEVDVEWSESTIAAVEKQIAGLLNQAVLEAGVEPLLGGVEYAEDIVQNMQLQTAMKQDDSFKRFVTEMSRFFQRRKQRD